jgi:hypothetical protein
VPPAILPLEPIALLTHDFASQSPLKAYPPVPAEALHQGEQLAIHAFGELLKDIRSPRHIYFTAWRDPDSHSGLPGEQDKPPTRILLHAQFGIAPYEVTASLVETAEMFNRLDRAGLGLDLSRDENGDFQLASLQLEMTNPSHEKGRMFRSCWQGEEIRRLDLSLQFDAPATRADAFRFHLQGRLPRRYNRGEKIEEEYVAFTATGGAMPLPPWVNY